MVQAADSMHLGLDVYAELGYIPSDHEHESVSKTLEYAFDDACVARMAGHLNRDDVARRFRQRASHWKTCTIPPADSSSPSEKALGMKVLNPER